ncbi:MAG: serine/threonine protein kinase, bacterial [Actinomycetota bacterium]|nr:serine/threonine protein kinase, bacterial [Actinomycetota bacterium]
MDGIGLFPAPPSRSPLSARAFGDQLLLGELIGRGGMSRVYRGWVRGTGREVAVKILRDDLASRPDAVQRFVRERDLLAAVSSPHVVRVHDLVVDGDELGIVMDLVPGGHLRRAVTYPCPMSTAAELGVQIADGLAAVHATGVIHRDLKPENVLVDSDGNGGVCLRLTDFGISRLVDAALTQTTVTGTPGYLAPEVAAGARPAAGADLYALGIVLYELCTGRAPFVADNPLVLILAHTRQEPRRPIGMPDSLWNLVAAMLAKSPEARPSASWVRDALRELAPRLQGLPLCEPPEPEPFPLDQPSEPAPPTVAGRALAPPTVAGQALAPPTVAGQQTGYAPGRGYTQDGYHGDGYSPEQYAQGGHAQGGYAQGGYAPDGYAQGGYAPDGYAQDGYAPNSYTGDGYGGHPGMFDGVQIMAPEGPGHHGGYRQDAGPSARSWRRDDESSAPRRWSLAMVPMWGRALAAATGVLLVVLAGAGVSRSVSAADGPIVPEPAPSVVTAAPAPTAPAPAPSTASAPSSSATSAPRTVRADPTPEPPAPSPSPPPPSASAAATTARTPTPTRAVSPSVPSLVRSTPSPAETHSSDGHVILTVGGLQAGTGSIASVTVRHNDGQQQVALGTPPTNSYTTTIDGLENGKKYTFRAEVCNTARLCSTSAPVEFTPYGAPVVPRPRLRASGTTVALSWAAVDRNFNPGRTRCTISVVANPSEPGLPDAKDASPDGDKITFTGKPGSSYIATLVCSTEEVPDGSASSAPILLAPQQSSSSSSTTPATTPGRI